jgi:hypothetical protein
MGLSRRAMKGTGSWLRNLQNQMSRHAVFGIGLLAAVAAAATSQAFEAVVPLTSAAASRKMRDGIVPSRHDFGLDRHCERSAAIQFHLRESGLPCRFAPRNDDSFKPKFISA